MVLNTLRLCATEVTTLAVITKKKNDLYHCSRRTWKLPPRQILKGMQIKNQIVKSDIARPIGLLMTLKNWPDTSAPNSAKPERRKMGCTGARKLANSRTPLNSNIMIRTKIPKAKVKAGLAGCRRPELTGYFPDLKAVPEPGIDSCSLL